MQLTKKTETDKKQESLPILRQTAKGIFVFQCNFILLHGKIFRSLL